MSVLHTFVVVGPLLGEGDAGSSIMGLLPVILMFAVIYLIVLRPMSKQEKDRRKRVEGLKKGDQVVIGGGILGRITNVDDPKVAVVEIADRVRIRVLKKDILDTQDNALKEATAFEKKGDKPETKAEAKVAAKVDANVDKASKADEPEGTAKPAAATSKDDEPARKGA